jgi:hypothetical protein
MILHPSREPGAIMSKISASLLVLTILSLPSSLIAQSAPNYDYKFMQGDSSYINIAWYLDNVDKVLAFCRQGQPNALTCTQVLHWTDGGKYVLVMRTKRRDVSTGTCGSYALFLWDYGITLLDPQTGHLKQCVPHCNGSSAPDPRNIDCSDFTPTFLH